MGIRELVLQLAKEEGMENAQTKIIKNLLLKTDHSLKEIADLADVSIDFVIEVKNDLRAESGFGG